ncbi:hypothetical protein T4C_1274 [Trichinella pseudospiralis]|uniref:Uncharacterized protein n=1 Tax=Trichinella pseudospiralis TaxID=6337 RepID=A0A0V1IHC9_TRIPS|nr:hypothetical protein T4C_1274 [Trichinella pseudospiralis]
MPQLRPRLCLRQNIKFSRIFRNLAPGVAPRLRHRHATPTQLKTYEVLSDAARNNGNWSSGVPCQI